MSEILQKAIHNCETGEIIIIPLTEEELEQRNKDLAEVKAAREAHEAESARIVALKEVVRAKLIAGEPLTEEEAALILI